MRNDEEAFQTLADGGASFSACDMQVACVACGGRKQATKPLTITFVGDCVYWAKTNFCSALHSL